MQAQTPEHDLILNKIFSGSTTVYLRAEKRVMPFKPAENLNSIIESIKFKIHKNPLLKNKIEKNGIELYLNEKLLSQLDISQAKLQSLKDYVNSINPEKTKKKNLREILNYFTKFIKETDRLKKEKYRKYAIIKAIKIKLEEIGVSVPEKKISIIPININTIVNNVKNDIKNEKNTKLEKNNKETVLIERLKQFSKARKENFNTIYVKPNKHASIRNIMIKSPGVISSIIGSTAELAGFPVAGLLTGTFTMAISIAHSVYALTMLNLHDRLRNKSSLLQVAFEFTYNRATELTYRTIKYISMPHGDRFISNGFAIKVILNSTVGAWFSTLGYNGWNRLVQKGIITRDKAAYFSEAAINPFLISQLATAYSGNPVWDLIYTITFGLSQIVDGTVWTLSKLLPAKTKLIIVSLDSEFDDYNKNITSKIKNSLLKEFAQKHGFILTDSFIKTPKLSNKIEDNKIKELFLEHNILLAEQILDLAIKHLKNNNLDKEIQDMNNLEFSAIRAKTESSVTYKDILFNHDFGLIPVLLQNLKSLSTSNIIKTNKFKISNNFKLKHTKTIKKIIELISYIEEYKQINGKHNTLRQTIKEIKKDLIKANRINDKREIILKHLNKYKFTKDLPLVKSTFNQAVEFDKLFSRMISLDNPKDKPFSPLFNAIKKINTFNDDKYYDFIASLNEALEEINNDKNKLNGLTKILLEEIYKNDEIILDSKHLELLKEIIEKPINYNYLKKMALSLKTWCS